MLFLGDFQISDTAHNEELGSITRRLNLHEKHSGLARSHQYLTAVVIMKYFTGEGGPPACTQGFERAPGPCQRRGEIDRRRGCVRARPGLVSSRPPHTRAFSPRCLPIKRDPLAGLGCQPAEVAACPAAAHVPPAPVTQGRGRERVMGRTLFFFFLGGGDTILVPLARGRCAGLAENGENTFQERGDGIWKENSSGCTLNKCHAVLEKLQRAVGFQSIS